MTTPTTAIVMMILLLITHTTSQQPNIVMILADDQGVGDIGYNQNFYNSTTYNTPWRLNQPHTPHLNAMANSTNSILFHRFYSGASICSPTRASILSGRNPLRECIGNAEGCGTKPAWSCLDRLPFPLPTFTIAEAAKLANYSTIHLGKWHLGDFFYKGNGEHAKLNVNDNHRRQPAHAPSNYAYQKWPVSNPGMHGFDEWRSTEASAPSSTTNCDCNPIWGQEGNGCIDGGGKWSQHGEGCTNYWYPMDNVSYSCRNMSAPHSISAQHCVTNETKKIQGDDSKYIVDHFETFVQKNVALNQPFLALLWFHTVHEPHPAMPEFYHAYKDVYGDPAGDYLGTLTQMDVQIGRIRNIVLENGIHNNTMIWYTADNGPHSANRDRSEFPALAATNGLRQCKASYYEGGIRVPGILEWPSVIKEHSNTWHPSGTVDYLHTILDVLGLKHPHPEWATDGISLLPLIQKLSASPNTNDTTRRLETNPLVFPGAIVNNEWKYTNGGQGQCKFQHGSSSKKSQKFMLFNLKEDPTESVDLSMVEVERFKNFTKEWEVLGKSILHSTRYESLCSRPPK